MKEIKATAPTPQDWIELVRENERLRNIAKIAFFKSRMSDEYRMAWDELMQLENKANDLLE